MRTYAERLLVLKLWESGKNKSVIAREAKIPRGTVRDIIEKYNGAVSELVYETDLKSVAPWACGFDPHQRYSYSYLLGLYLGDGCISKQSRTLKLRIHLDDKYPNIQLKCKQAMADVFPGNKVGQENRENSSIIYVHNNAMDKVFPQHGPGKKHDREIKLVDWQVKIVKESPKEFIRGLYHSDGCRYIVNGHSNYQFTNCSEDIIKLYEWACDLLDIKYRTNLVKAANMTNAKSKNKADRYTVYVRKRSEVEKMEAFLKPKS